MPRLRYLISEDRKIADPDLQSFNGTGYHPAANFKSNWTKCIRVGEEDVDNTLENAKRLGLGLGDMRSRTSTSSSNGQLSTEAIVRSPFEWWVHMVVLRACEVAKSQVSNGSLKLFLHISQTLRDHNIE
jgi:hypothetical protein